LLGGAGTCVTDQARHHATGALPTGAQQASAPCRAPGASERRCKLRRGSRPRQRPAPPRTRCRLRQAARRAARRQRQGAVDSDRHHRRHGQLRRRAGPAADGAPGHAAGRLRQRVLHAVRGVGRGRRAAGAPGRARGAPAASKALFKCTLVYGFLPLTPSLFARPGAPAAPKGLVKCTCFLVPLHHRLLDAFFLCRLAVGCIKAVRGQLSEASAHARRAALGRGRWRLPGCSSGARAPSLCGVTA